MFDLHRRLGSLQRRPGRRREASKFQGRSFFRPMVETLETRRLLAADSLEPNDSFQEARDLGTGSQTQENLTIHVAGNDDFYRWTASGNGTLQVNLIFSQALGNLDLKIFDATEAVLATSTSTTDNEQLSVEVLADQDYVIQ
ncbi:MAG: hypothetical protein ACC628_24855, partial [Pirellulaceae bacterium]